MTARARTPRGVIGSLSATSAVLVALLLPLAGPAAGASAAARAWDFDGDGHRDLAVGALGEDDLAGSVTVVPGTRTGLATAAAYRLDQDSPGVPGLAEPGDLFGAALASGDFDADGFADLAVATPGENSDTDADVGGVVVLYGSTHGVTGKRAVRLARPDVVFGAPDPEHSRLGYLLTAGDLDRDGRADLVATVEGDGPAGLLVYRGGADGLSRLPRQAIAPGYGLPAAESTYVNDLALGDLDGNGTPDLAVGGMEASQAEGAVTVIYSARGYGLDPRGAHGRKAQVWTRSTTGVQGAPRSDSAFGSAVGIGDVTGDGHKDLVVTAKLIPSGTSGTGGQLHVLPGSSHGVTATGDQLFAYDALVDEPVGSFGYAVAVGDLNGNGVADVAVTHASADANEAGAVSVLYGAKGGLSADRVATFTQDSAGIGGVNRPDVDYWGLSLRIRDVGGSAAPDLVAADPFEPIDGADAGIVTVLWGSTQRVSGTRSRTVSESTPGIPGGAEDGDRFGGGL